jgi:rhodanese-related sulfurtransferase
VRAVDIPEIDVQELARRRQEGAVIVDVRQPDEYADAHVPGARLIPLGELGGRLGEVPADRDVLVICRTGGRSRKAAELMAASGRRALNGAGGTLAWIESGEPVAHGPEPG